MPCSYCGARLPKNHPSETCSDVCARNWQDYQKRTSVTLTEAEAIAHDREFKARQSVEEIITQVPVTSVATWVCGYCKSKQNHWNTGKTCHHCGRDL